MDKDIKNLIEQFIADIKADYPDLYINYDYDEEKDEYEIWHNDSNLEYKDARFKKIVGINAEKWLFSNDIFNFYFAYDHHKAKEKSKTYTFNTNAVQPQIEKMQDTDEESFEYKTSINKLEMRKGREIVEVSIKLKVFNSLERKIKFTNANSKKTCNWEKVITKSKIEEMGLVS